MTNKILENLRNRQSVGEVDLTINYKTEWNPQETMTEVKKTFQLLLVNYRLRLDTGTN